MKNFLRYTLGLLFTLGCAATPARAQGEGNPANWCRNGAFPSDSDAFKLARVEGRRGSRVYFQGDGEGCPGPAPRCRQKAYVVPGDQLLVSRTFGDWVCAWYQPARGPETVGWLPAERLGVTAADANPRLTFWLGDWKFYDDSLRLSRGKGPGSIHVEGAATWFGVNPGNVHVGEVSGEDAPTGNALKIEYEECLVTLRLVGPYLVASDNKQCGGVNVTFDGVYRKK